MDNYIKEFMNKEFDKIVFNEQGIIFRKGKYSEGAGAINHCFCPYGSIKKISFFGCLQIEIFVNGKTMLFVYYVDNSIEKMEIKEAMNYAKLQIKKSNSASAIIYKDEEPVYDKTLKVVETRMHCKVCGHIYCYNANDIEKNRQRIKDARWSSLAGLASAYSGNYTASAVNTQSASNAINSIIDYSICPKCNSRDVVEISEEELKNLHLKTDTNETVISNVDELKKFKELLDIGVITQEEFDAKKKQLLGL